MSGYVNSAFRLIIDGNMIQHLKNRTEKEARRIRVTETSKMM